MESLPSGKKEWRPAHHHRRTCPEHGFCSAGSGRARHGTIFRTCERGYKRTDLRQWCRYTCGVPGLPEPFKDMFALDPVEAWEVDIARVVDQGWNEFVYAVYTVLAVVPLWVGIKF